jgi:hypothetical protein
MVDYNCKRCGYTAKAKSVLLKHLNRKRICDPKIGDIPVATLINDVEQTNVEQVSTEQTSIVKKSVVDDLIQCLYCYRVYESKKMQKHQVDCSKEIMNTIKQLNDKIAELSRTRIINNDFNKTFNVNNYISVHFFNDGKELYNGIFIAKIADRLSKHIVEKLTLINTEVEIKDKMKKLYEVLDKPTCMAGFDPDDVQSFESGFNIVCCQKNDAILKKLNELPTANKLKNESESK